MELGMSVHTTKNRKLGLLISGGIDSFVAWFYAQKVEGWKPEDIMCIYIDIGNPYAEKEKQAIERFRKYGIDTKYLKCELIQEQFGNVPTNEDIWIAGRNLTLATIMASIGADEIWVCALKGEMHKFATDKNKKFFDMATETLSYVHGKFKDKIIVRTPFEEMSKLDVCRWALENGITKEMLLETSSCLSGGEGNCGNCMVCVRRFGIFRQLGFEEKYNENPLTSEVGKKYIRQLAEDIGIYNHYDRARIDEVLPSLKEEELKTLLTAEQMERLKRELMG
jgi:7-cyano-7-deazaguanine synthase in queuosine biosynthesis